MRVSRLTGQKGFTISELLLVFVVVAMLAAALMPVIVKIHRSMDETACTINLQKIGLAMYIYAQEHDGEFPASLKTLYDEQYLSEDNLMDCPASKEIGTPDDPSYIYTAGLSVKEASLAILVRDKEKNHPRGKNILYVNGDLVWK